MNGLGRSASRQRKTTGQNHQNHAHCRLHRSILQIAETPSNFPILDFAVEFPASDLRPEPESRFRNLGNQPPRLDAACDKLETNIWKEGTRFGRLLPRLRDDNG